MSLDRQRCRPVRPLSLRRKAAIENLEARRLMHAEAIVGGGGISAIVSEPASSPATMQQGNQIAAAIDNGLVITGRNLWVRDAYLTDGDGNRVDRPAVGARVFVQAEFSVRDLPATCSSGFFVVPCTHTLDFQIDGQHHTSGPLNWGLGVSGTTSWVGRLGDWVVTSGAHTVQVKLDSTARIAETVESDNSMSFQFTPVTFGSDYGESRFRTPLGGAPNVDWSIVNYVDLNSGDGVQDYQGGNYTYNGHTAIDYAVSNFAVMERGVPIFAAATGVVKSTRDGGFDRNTCPTVCMKVDNWGNFVTIDHGNGWETRYMHLREDSVSVSPGDVIKAGDTLGIMGSSGNSSDAHLHFEVRHQGLVVETYIAPSSYWQSPLPYSANVPGVLDFGTTDHNPNTVELKDRPDDVNVFRTTDDEVHFWVHVHSIADNTPMSIVWRRPNGTVFRNNAFTANQIRYGWLEDHIDLPGAASGVWSVSLLRNGSLMAEHDFEVTSGASSDIEFETANYYAAESEGIARIAVTRSGTDTNSMSVKYTTLSQTAQPGADYTSVSGTLTFLPGQRRKTINIPLVNDMVSEPNERFLVMLSDPTGGAYLGTQWLTGVNLVDNDALLDYNASLRRLSIGSSLAGDDEITIDMQSQDIRIDVNGRSCSFPASLVDLVEVNAGAGNDQVRVYETAAGVDYIVRGGAGNDAVTVGRPGGFLAGSTLDDIRGDIEVYGDSGNDSLVVRDSWLTGVGRSYRLTNVAVQRVDPLVISLALPSGGNNPSNSNTNSGTVVVPALSIVKSVGYHTLESIDLYTRPQSDHVTLNDVAAPTRIHTGLGDDTVVVQSARGGVSIEVDGSGGADSFSVDAEDFSGTLTIDGGASAESLTDHLTVVGTGTSLGTYLPDASHSGDGLIGLAALTLAGDNLHFKHIERATVHEFGTFKLLTPNDREQLTIDTQADGTHYLSGSSGAVPITPLAFYDVARLEVDMELVDSGQVGDSLVIHAADLPAAGVDELVVRGGPGATSVSANSGVTNLQVVPHASGQAHVMVQSGARVNLTAAQRFATFQIASQGHVALLPGGNNTLVVGTLDIAGNVNPAGVIDMHDNAIIVNYEDGAVSPLPLHQAQILHARDENTPQWWTGHGVTSARAAAQPSQWTVTAREAEAVFGGAGGNFHGVALAPGDRAVLIALESLAPALPGDLNSDGAVDALDAQILFSNWGQSGVGDINGDGIVDAADAGELFHNWTGDSLGS